MKKVLCLAVIASLAVMTACSGDAKPSSAGEEASVGFRDSGLPVVDKTVTLRFSGQKAPLAPNFNDMTLVKQWQKDTNLAISWENLPENVYKEKKNLLLASGDLPDAFYNTGFTDEDIAVNGANGTLIPLEDLIGKYAPNLKEIFAKRPEIKAAVTASDGHIYTLPAAEELGIGAVPFFWSINKTWLAKVGLPMPTTTEDYYQVLQAFKTKDPNGNGKADEIPLSFIGGFWCADVGDLFAALTGLPDNPDHRIVRDDKVIHTASQTQYRDAIATLHKWYQEGLIDREAFTQTDKQYLAKGKSKTPVVGSFVWWETEEVVGASRTGDYTLMGPLQGAAGRLVGRANGGDYARDAFAITRVNKYPAATMRWVDRLYDPVMSAQVAWGPIGEGLRKDASGLLTAMPDKPGESAGERKQRIAPVGPRVILKEDFKTVVAPEPRAAQRQKDLERIYLPYAEKQSYPLVFFTQEELQRANEIATELKAMVDEKRASWIVRGGVDQEWDGYLKGLKDAGLDEYLKIYQTAYDRHREAK